MLVGPGVLDPSTREPDVKVPVSAVPQPEPEDPAEFPGGPLLSGTEPVFV